MTVAMPSEESVRLFASSLPGSYRTNFDFGAIAEHAKLSLARESAQANVFVWGSLGRAHIGETGADDFAWNLGGQLDYETRRVYASLRTDLHESSAFSHRIDTLQLGIAPYEHEYDRLALWFVVQARETTGGLTDGTELAALLRLFKRNAWVEVGLTQDGKLQAMVMFNF